MHERWGFALCALLVLGPALATDKALEGAWELQGGEYVAEQIADFVQMHPLEVQAIADGEVAQGIIGYDPVQNGQVTREDIARAEADPNARLHLSAGAIPARRFSAANSMMRMAFLAARPTRVTSPT